MTRELRNPPPDAIAGAGFALLEALICIMALAVGLIGAGMMHLHATRTTEESNLHDTALALAMPIADELRANDAQVRLPAGSSAFTSFAYAVPVVAAPASAPWRNCYAQTCIPAQMAAQSLNDWRLRTDPARRRPDRNLSGKQAPRCRCGADLMYRCLEHCSQYPSGGQDRV